MKVYQNRTLFVTVTNMFVEEGRTKVLKIKPLIEWHIIKGFITEEIEISLTRTETIALKPFKKFT